MVDDFGTSVRLYLRVDAPDSDTLLRSVQSWLALPEVTVTIQNGLSPPFEMPAGLTTTSFDKSRGGVLLPIAGSESSHGVPRAYIAPQRPVEASRLPGEETGREESVVLVDGIVTTLAGQPWPTSLIINLTEELSATLTVDRRSADPTAAALKVVLQWVQTGGGDAFAAWEHPEFLGLYKALSELHPDVTVGTDRALRQAVEQLRGVAPPFADSRWQLSKCGLSDLDPTIAAELVANVDGNAEDFNHERYELGRLHVQAEGRWGIMPTRRAFHPITAQAMLARAGELFQAGAVLPGKLREAVAFSKERRPLRSWPRTSRLVLNTIEISGHVALRELVRWTEAQWGSALAAAELVHELDPNLFTCRIEAPGELGTQHRRLIRLSSANEVTWLDLAYFAQSEAVTLDSALAVARDLSVHGVTVPDESQRPHDTSLSSAEFDFLSSHFNKSKDLPKHEPFSSSSLHDYMSGVPAVVIDSLNKLLRRFGSFRSHRIGEAPPPNLNRDQRLVLSHSFDGLAPFLTAISLKRLFECAFVRQFGTLENMVTIARSLPDNSVNLDQIMNLDAEVIRYVDSLSWSPDGGRVLLRLADALERQISLNIWDLALTATVAKLELHQLRPVVRFLESRGADVTECYEFLAYCATSVAK
jgi:hypothetical protein